MTVALEVPVSYGLTQRKSALLAPTPPKETRRTRCNAAPPLEPLHETDARSRKILKSVDSGKKEKYANRLSGNACLPVN